MLTIGAIAVWLTMAIVQLAGVQVGDSSIAASVAAIASILNAVILWRARVAQDEIAEDVKHVKDDTLLREHQIEQLRSLSVERNRQILRLERVADRYEANVRPDGRRHYDPPRTPPPEG